VTEKVDIGKWKVDLTVERGSWNARFHLPPTTFRTTFQRPPSTFREAPMDLSIIGLNFGYAILGVVLMWLSYRLFDLMTPKVDFAEELKKGNVAVAIFIAALFLSIAIIIGHALN
jgi:hypothetical protein